MTRKYHRDDLEKIIKIIDEIPKKNPSTIGEDEFISKLSKHIRILHEKNYEIREIVAILKETNVKITQKKVKEIISKNTSQIKEN